MRNPIRSTLAVLVVSGLALAPAQAANPRIADLAIGGAEAVWTPRVSGYDRIVLDVAGPAGAAVRQEFAEGQVPSLGLYDAFGAPLPDGVYKFELTLVPRVDAATRERLEAARQGGDAAVAELRRDGLLPASMSRQTGYFSIAGGAFVAPDAVEPVARAKADSIAAPGGPQGVVLTNADGVIRNSLCVGFDCPNSPSFSDTTILMMENNTRIKFDDTSTLGGFPNNDWEIEANSNASGGANYFGVNDCGNSSQGGCATDLVFAIESGVRSSALYVESDGDVGFGTSNPTVNLHVVDGNTPTLRLEQDGSSGFAPQTWDVAGNETNFFIRDATGGSQLPFRIQPGADSNSLFISSTNNVGVGTSSPSASLHVRRTDASAQVFVEEANAASANRVLARLSNNGPVSFEYNDTANSNTWRINLLAGGMAFNQTVGGNVAGAINEVVINEDGDIEAVGTITGGIAMPSSREYKTGFQPVDVRAVLAKVAQLPITTWTYDRGLPTDGVPHLGPVAEDFHEAFGLGEGGDRIELVDTTGVALAAIQGLYDVLQERDAQVAELQQRLESLEQALQASPVDE